MSQNRVFRQNLVSSTILAQSFDGATVTIERDGAAERYRLVAQPDPAPAPPAPDAPTPDHSKPADASGATQPASDRALAIVGQERTAPAVISVHALELGVDPLTTRFEWDFGDAGSRFNTLSGFVAGHVYDTPGQYTITLKLTPAGKDATVHRRTITVAPDPRRTIEVSSSAELVKACQTTDNVQILLRRGAVFEIDRTLLTPGLRVTLGAFGDPKLARPVIRYTGKTSGEPIIRCSDKTIGLTVRDITFDSVARKPDDPTPHAIIAAGRQIAIRNCTFLNINYCINGNGRPEGVVVQDCNAPDPAGVRAYLAWVEGSDWTIAGNRMVNPTREHVVRAWEFKRVLVTGNDFANADRTAIDPIDIAKTALNLQAGEFAWVSDNDLRGPTLIGPLGKSNGLKFRQQRSRTYVVENNRFYNAPLEVQHGLSGAVIRDNTFRVNDGRSIGIDGWDSQYQRGAGDIVIHHNTAHNAGTRGGFLYVGGAVAGITLTGNSYVAPRLEPGSYQTAAVYVNGGDLSSFRSIADNTWPRGKPKAYAQGGVMYVWPGWSDARGYLDPAEWLALPQVKGDRFE